MGKLSEERQGSRRDVQWRVGSLWYSSLARIRIQPLDSRFCGEWGMIC